MNDLAARDAGDVPPPVRAGGVAPERVVTDAIAGGAGLVVAVGEDPAARRACAGAVARARLSAGDDVVVLAAGPAGLSDACLATALGLDPAVVPAALFDLPAFYATAGLRLVAVVCDAQHLTTDKVAGIRQLAALRSPALTILLIGDGDVAPVADELMATGLCFVRLDPEPAEDADTGGYEWEETVPPPDDAAGPGAPYAYHPVDISFSPVLPDWVSPDVPTLVPARDEGEPAPVALTGGALPAEPAPCEPVAGIPAALVWDAGETEDDAATEDLGTDAALTWAEEPAVAEANEPAAWTGPTGVPEAEVPEDAGAPETGMAPAVVPEAVESPSAHEWPEAAEAYQLGEPLSGDAGAAEEGGRFDEYSSAFAYLAAQDSGAAPDEGHPEDEDAVPVPVAAPAQNKRGRSRLRWLLAACVALAVAGGGWFVAGRMAPGSPTPGSRVPGTLAAGSAEPASRPAPAPAVTPPPVATAHVATPPAVTPPVSEPPLAAAPAFTAPAPEPPHLAPPHSPPPVFVSPVAPPPAFVPPAHAPQPAAAAAAGAPRPPKPEVAAASSATAAATTSPAAATKPTPAAPTPVSPSAPAPHVAAAAEPSPVIARPAPSPSAATPPAQAALTQPALTRPVPAQAVPGPAVPGPAAQSEKPATASDTAGAAVHTSPPKPAGPGLLVIAKANDTLRSLYERVYRGLQAPPFEVVAAMNPSDIRLGDVVVFPAPPGGWKRLTGLTR